MVEHLRGLIQELRRGVLFNPLSWKCHYSGFTPCHGEALYFGVECYNFNHFLMTSFSLSLPIFKVSLTDDIMLQIFYTILAIRFMLIKGMVQ